MSEDWHTSIRRWSVEQRAYMEWLAVPKQTPGREVRSKGEFARSIGVGVSTLKRWRHLPGFRQEVARLSRGLINGRLGEALEALECRAVEGSLGHQRLYLKLMGIEGMVPQAAVGIMSIKGECVQYAGYFAGARGRINAGHGPSWPAQDDVRDYEHDYDYHYGDDTMSTELTTTDFELTYDYWTAGQVAYIGWLAMPKEFRPAGLKTEVAFARSIGVKKFTLWRWKQQPGFREEVIRLARSFMGDRLPEVLRSIEDMAAEGSLGHQRLYLELMGINGPELPPMFGIKVIQGVRLEDV